MSEKPGWTVENVRKLAREGREKFGTPDATGLDLRRVRALGWPEDWLGDNGEYLSRCHECGEMFLGHKRRIKCKPCAALPAPPGDQP